MKIAIVANHNETRRAFDTLKKFVTALGTPLTNEDCENVYTYLAEDHSKDTLRSRTFAGYTVEIQDTSIIIDVEEKAYDIIMDAADDVCDQIGGWVGFIKASLGAFRGIGAGFNARWSKTFGREKTYATTVIYDHTLDLCHTFLVEDDGYGNRRVKQINHITPLADGFTPKVLRTMMWRAAKNKPLEFYISADKAEAEFERYTRAVRMDWEGDKASGKSSNNADQLPDDMLVDGIND